MLARFFVSRPIFAIVLSLVIMLAGIMSLTKLPQEQYPSIAMPEVYISATYTGASAETVENTVTKIIEKELRGLDGLVSFSSTSDSTGNASITLTFKQGTNPDTAQTQVNNRVQQVVSSLPLLVQQNGVSVQKGMSGMLMIVTIYDETDKSTDIDVSDYLIGNIRDPLSRLDGVGKIELMGGEYAMRIWLDPNKLRSYNLMPSDIEASIKNQNTEVAIGQIGAQPSANLNLTANVTAVSMLKTVADFENIVVKNDSDGALVHLSDVAKVELGSDSYTVISTINGHPASGLMVQPSSGANALETSAKIRALVNSYADSMPQGYKILYSNDNSEFVKISIKEVVKTLIEAIILVIIVMFLFLRNWRATIIPALTVPVVLLGTFATLNLLGYSINTLTLFALVLAIGLLVDDAIVVVENVERVIKETGLSAKEATIKSMNEVTSALIGIAVVISVVFIPMAFLGGSTGVIYRQFSVTIVTAMVLSVFVAITLTPALCGSMLKSQHKQRKGGFFGKLLNKYEHKVAGVIKRPVRFMAAYAAAVAVAALLLVNLPTGFIPNEDQGSLMAVFTLPDGADLSRTKEISKQIDNYFLTKEADNVDNIFTTLGFGFAGDSQNSGMSFITLKDWSKRKGKSNSADSIAERATAYLSSTTRDAEVYIMNLPPIEGIGMSDGIEYYIQAKNTNISRNELAALKDKYLEKINTSRSLTYTRSPNAKDALQLHLDFNRDKALAYNLALDDIYNTLGTAWSGRYINDFIQGDRSKKVYIQSLAEFRSKPEDLTSWTVRNGNNDMVPYSEFTTSRWQYAPALLERYNGFAAYKIESGKTPGISSGTAMADISKAISNFPNLDYAWTGISYQESQSSGQAMKLYALSILVVFLCLAALYESWSVPASVLLVIPLGITGAVIATTLRGLDNNIYFQMALLTTIGLSSKNAIMMVEFSESAFKAGKSIFAAAVEGARLRLRPILMTSFAFLAGVMPLTISSGVGANSRIAIGSGIVGGTLLATLLSIFMVPLFFVIVKKLFGHKSGVENA